jgi:mycofactocin precursor
MDEIQSTVDVIDVVDAPAAEGEPQLESLIEDVSIDGMCGVY